MQRLRRILPLLVLVWCGWVLAAEDDDLVALVKKQKEKARANWKRVYEDQPAVHVETESFLFYASKTFDREQLKEWGATYDELLKETRKALALEGDGKKPMWLGKMAIYLFEDRRDYNSFVRGVLKKRPQDVGTGAYSLRTEEAFVTATKPTSKDEPSVDVSTADQLITAIFQKFAGENNAIPDWVMQGFVTATTWRTADNEMLKKKTEADRKKVLALLNRKPARSCKEIFGGTVSGEDAYLLRGSLIEYLAYGPDADKFPALLKAFRPEMPNQGPKPIDAVLATIKLYPEKLDRVWINWVKAGGK